MSQTDQDDVLAPEREQRLPAHRAVARQALGPRRGELERKLRIANALIALQKKAHEVLGLALPESDGDS